MWATIEHLRKPRATVEKLFHMLKPGGMFIFNTGNDQKYLRYLSSGYSMWYDLPGHLFFYNPRSIKVLLKFTGFKK